MAANLIYEAFSEYYDLFGFAKRKMIGLISEQFGMDGSEIRNSFVLTDGGDKISAGMSVLPARDLNHARMTGSFHLLSPLGIEQKASVLNNLKFFSNGIPEVPEDSFYLSRIAVASEFRRKKRGSVLLEEFAVLGKEFPTLGLHVNAEKTEAVQFYINNGYKTIGPDGLSYLAMVKNNHS